MCSSSCSCESRDGHSPLCPVGAAQIILLALDVPEDSISPSLVRRVLKAVEAVCLDEVGS